MNQIFLGSAPTISPTAPFQGATNMFLNDLAMLKPQGKKEKGFCTTLAAIYPSYFYHHSLSKIREG
jgi:hypothetical protein